MSRSRRIVGILLATAALILPLSSAAAVPATGPSPAAGPTRGGTQISGQVESGAPIPFRHVGAGGDVAWALEASGAAYRWGDGSAATPQFALSPTSGSPFAQTAPGVDFALFRDEDGAVWGAGTRAKGQLGNDDPVSQVLYRTELPAGATAVRIAAGAANGYAIVEGPGAPPSGAFAWGLNDRGQLGRLNTGTAFTPLDVQVPAGVRFVDVAAGATAAFAVDASGSLWAWGRGVLGRVAPGTASGLTSFSEVPIAVDAPAGVRFTRVFASPDARDVAYAIDETGTAWAWGDNGDYRLGTTQVPAGQGGIGSAVPVPVEAPAGARFTEIAVGAWATYALDASGRVYSWGADIGGTLGLGALAPQDALVLLPTRIPVGGTIAQIASGRAAGYALDTNGALWAWGQNHDGQLGTGTSTGATRPAPVQRPVSDTRVTAVTIAGVAVSALASTDQGGWTAKTPRAALDVCGPVDVVVSYTRNQATFTQEHPDGFTYNTPCAPARPTVVAGDGKVTVSFQPPSGDGGSPIQEYIVLRASPLGGTVRGSSSPITVTGLTNGVTYTFAVAARNTNGSSLFSLPSEPVTPGETDVEPTPTPTAEEPTATPTPTPTSTQEEPTPTPTPEEPTPTPTDSATDAPPTSGNGPEPTDALGPEQDGWLPGTGGTDAAGTLIVGVLLLLAGGAALAWHSAVVSQRRARSTRTESPVQPEI